MSDSAQDASLAQLPVRSSQTTQRNPGKAPDSAAGVSNPPPVQPPAAPAQVGTIAPGTVRVVGVTPSRPSAGFPDDKSSGPEIWRPFFSKSQPNVRAVQRHVMYLTDQQQHAHVIALLNAAIIEGQAQPWMYEVLAVTMGIAKYPQEEIERVALSVADFGNASYESMMYSGAYLAKFNREAAAMRMYRQAARMTPDRPEPHYFSLKLAAKTGVADDAIWAACGVLRNSWGVDHLRQHEQAEDLLAETERQLQKTKQVDQLALLNEQAIEARRRDLQIKLKWNGAGDLDLSVQDPAGGVASFNSRESAGGGYLLNDGYGPTPENCHEDFVCPQGFTGEYVITVKKASGKIVGDRGVLTIVTHAGSPEEKTETKSVSFAKVSEQAIKVTLEEGRREQRRTAFFAAPQGVARDWERAAAQVGRPARRGVNREARQVVAEMQESRQKGVVPAGGAVGGVGFAPVVSLIPEGASLAVQAVVSPDRRYVRLAISPTFNQIIDVAVFSFQGNGSGSTTTGR